MRVETILGSVAVAMLWLAVSAVASAADEPAAKLDWMQKAHGDGRHNSFTDLIRWQGHYYLCFRHGASHGSMDGEIRILRSVDMKDWQPCATLRTLGDDRDPHFVSTEDTLLVYFGVWSLVHPEGHGTPTRGSVRSHFASTQDGQTWSEVRGVYEPGWWLWRVVRHEGLFYSVGYTAIRPTPSQREGRLLVSDDGLEWSLVSVVTRDRMPTESDIWFDGTGAIHLIMRMQDKVNEAFVWRSDPPFEQWDGHSVGAVIHSPALARWGDRFFVAGRGVQDGKWVTRLWELVDGQAHELLTLPSGGDTSYPGLLVDPATANAEAPTLFISWYSQHERESEPDATANTASVYVGRITIVP